jgi:hypothetical protein
VRASGMMMIRKYHPFHFSSSISSPAVAYFTDPSQLVRIAKQGVQQSFRLFFILFFFFWSLQTSRKIKQKRNRNGREKPPSGVIKINWSPCIDRQN